MKQDNESTYIWKNNKKLRYGYTTGTCAAAAAKACAKMLLSGESMEVVTIDTPKGISLTLDLLDIHKGEGFVSCGVQKDSGDDPDVTNGILVYAKVSFLKEAKIVIDGGTGVGRVTKKGLNQPVGAAAINQVPRSMIHDAVLHIIEEYEYEAGLSVIISVPSGIEIAKKTFNPRLGIEGGISILGTSGIVEPMSESALVDSIKVEINLHLAQGEEYLLIAPGNYGEDFVKDHLSVDFRQVIKCSNYIGETIDIAVELKAKGILLIGHIGKLIKVAGGIMNTHSKNADARMEILAANAAVAGADTSVLVDIMKCVTTEEALDFIIQAGILKEVMDLILDKIEFYLNKRAYDSLKIGVVLFSSQYGYLGQTKMTKELMNDINPIKRREI